MNSYQVGVSAEAFSAAVLARCGYNVSVQYGANQPEYDLMAESNDKILKISVKGSQDGGWGLTQSYLKNNNSDYHQAIDAWLKAHHKRTVFCLVQFKNTETDQMPRIYFATPGEIADALHKAKCGGGNTVLYENHKWKKDAKGRGTTDKIPDEWQFSAERLQALFDKYGE